MDFTKPTTLANMLKAHDERAEVEVLHRLPELTKGKFQMVQKILVPDPIGNYTVPAKITLSVSGAIISTTGPLTWNTRFIVVTNKVIIKQLEV